MSFADVNGARVWYEEEGSGPAVVFVHGGLGDSRLWEPQARALASRFRTIRYDLRFWGRTESPGVEASLLDDLVGLLDALDVDRAAVVGLSLGGGLALDAAVLRPERVWALAHVAGGISGSPFAPYTDDEDAAFTAAIERRDLDAAMAIDWVHWAPLGATDEIRELWLATPEAKGIPDGAGFREESVVDRLEDVRAPTLVVVASHDPDGLRELGATVARRVPGARLVELDSDHYLTLREPERLTGLLSEFLADAAAA